MINVRMQPTDVKRLSPKITVLGVGGAGGNAVNNMISSGLEGCEFVVCNSDAQALEGSLADNKVQLGATVTGGLGAGAKPEIGRLAAEETLDDVLQYLEGSNMAFITAGMGGGTGTGAAPVIAKAARDKGILTVGVVTKPFHFEGSHRMKMAEEGIKEMQSYVDTLIVIPNQNLFRVANEKTTFAEAFKMADSVLQSGVRGVTDLMVMPGLINLDFADIRSAMLEMGKAMMGTGEAEGDRRAIEAAEAAINNPLLDDVSMKGARGVIINVTGGMDMTLFEVDEACNRIRDEVDPNANIIFGSTFDEKLDGMMRVSVVATGIDAAESKGRVTVTGGGIVNAVTGSERRMERNVPNTGSVSTGDVSEKKPSEAEKSAASVAMSAMQGAAGSGSSQYTAPVTPQTAAGVAASRKDGDVSAVAGDMFAQSKNVVPEAEASSPRGTVYNNAFIPPAPVVPEQVSVTAEQPVQATMQVEATHIQDAEMHSAPIIASESEQILAASRPQPEQSAATEAATQPTISAPRLNLKPPVPGANAQQRQQNKTPSLFERITNPIRHYAEDKLRGGMDDGENKVSAGTVGSSGGISPRSSAAPAQASLNIDAPKGATETQADDELDIPAFLRRQAN